MDSNLGATPGKSYLPLRMLCKVGAVFVKKYAVPAMYLSCPHMYKSRNVYEFSPRPPGLDSSDVLPGPGSVDFTQSPLVNKCLEVPESPLTCLLNLWLCLLLTSCPLCRDRGCGG